MERLADRPERHDTLYLRFRPMPIEPGKKMQVWLVDSVNHGFTLGAIKWYGGWRQYVFVPEPETLYNSACLSDIREFIQRLMAEWRNR